MRRNDPYHSVVSCLWGRQGLEHVFCDLDGQMDVLITDLRQFAVLKIRQYLKICRQAQIHSGRYGRSIHPGGLLLRELGAELAAHPRDDLGSGAGAAGIPGP